MVLAKEEVLFSISGQLWTAIDSYIIFEGISGNGKLARLVCDSLVLLILESCFPDGSRLSPLLLVLRLVIYFLLFM